MWSVPLVANWRVLGATVREVAGLQAMAWTLVSWCTSCSTSSWKSGLSPSSGSHSWARVTDDWKPRASRLGGGL